MRAIWKGAVSFGLVSIGVKLFSATEEKDIRFHQVHRTDGGRIKYQRTCSIDGEVVSYDDIAKGYDIGGGEMVSGPRGSTSVWHIPAPTTRTRTSSGPGSASSTGSSEYGPSLERRTAAVICGSSIGPS